MNESVRTRKWFKAALVGAGASLVLYVLMYLGVDIFDVAPVNRKPSRAFLAVLDIQWAPMAIALHFAYGMLWSIILAGLLRRGTNVWAGFGLGIFLWLILGLVFAPIIGWGVFGFGGPAHDLSQHDPMHIASGTRFVIGSLIGHLMYGGLVGWLNGVWIRWPKPRTQPEPVTAA